MCTNEYASELLKNSIELSNEKCQALTKEKAELIRKLLQSNVPITVNEVRTMILGLPAMPSKLGDRLIDDSLDIGA